MLSGSNKCFEMEAQVAIWKNPRTATGGDEVYFWSNGLLVLDSYIFSKTKE